MTVAVKLHLAIGIEASAASFSVRDVRVHVDGGTDGRQSGEIEREAPGRGGVAVAHDQRDRRAGGRLLPPGSNDCKNNDLNRHGRE